MTLYSINIGTTANDGTGDDLRTAFQKVNENFNTLNATAITNVINLGDGEHLYTGGYSSLSLKTLINGDNITLSSSDESITISTKDSINSLFEDQNPTLSNDLYVNGHDIKSNSPFNIVSYNGTSFNYNTVSINSLLIDGNNHIGNGTTNVKTRTSDNLKISADLDLILQAGLNISIQSNIVSSSNITAQNLYGDTYGLHSGDVIGNIIGNVNGNTIGVHTGNVIGNVTGTVSNIENHSIMDLADVSMESPTLDQILVWNGTEYYPTTLDNLVFNTITISEQVNLNVIQSYTNNSIELNSPLRMINLSSTQRDMLIAKDGEIIYNTTEHKFQGFQNGSWVNISL